jgi:pimeloyl-ACP methyl ester carboxylesterase
MFVRRMLLALCMAALLSAGCARVRAPRQQTKPILGLRESRRNAPEFGGSLYVLEAGPRDAPALVLIHGLGANGARDFDPILPALSQRYRVLAFDLPGLGRSDHANEAYAPSRYARMVHTLIAEHFGKPVLVVGHSLGAAVALELAGRYPESVARLALLDVAGVLHYREYLRHVIAGSEQELDWFTRARRGARSFFFSVGMAPAAALKLEQLALRESPTLRSFFSSSTTAAMLLLQHDFGPALRSVRAPTLIGWGKHDAVAPLRTAQALRAFLHPRAFVLFERSGHVPMQSEPAAVADALHTFFSAPEPPHSAPHLRARGRVATCHRQRDRVFEGDYDAITLHRCKRVLLRNVRAGSLWLERSEAELVDVELDSPGVAAVVKHSRLTWTGGRIRAAVCIDTEGSELDLAAVECRATRESLRVHQPSRLAASVSALSVSEQTVSVHGEYELLRTREGELPELRALRDVGMPSEHGRTSLGADDLANGALAHEDFTGASLRGANLSDADLRGAVFTGADLRHATLREAHLRDAKLQGADLRRADLSESDLRGADLRGADLRGARWDGANLRGALYDTKTRLPRGLDPVRSGMHASDSTPPAAFTVRPQSVPERAP